MQCVPKKFKVRPEKGKGHKTKLIYMLAAQMV